MGPSLGAIGFGGRLVRVSIVVGSADRLTPPSASRQMAAMLTAAGNTPRFVVLPGLGHCSNLQDPAAVTAEIEQLAVTVVNGCATG